MKVRQRVKGKNCEPITRHASFDELIGEVYTYLAEISPLRNANLRHPAAFDTRLAK